MKFIFLILFNLNAHAVVIRSLDSNSVDYLERTTDTYVNLQLNQIASQKSQVEINLESLEKITESINEIQKQVLNTESRQILFFLLRRQMELIDDAMIYRRSLLRLKSLIQADNSLLDLLEDSELRNKIIALENKNLASAVNILKKFKSSTKFSDAQILMDGLPIKMSNHWQAPRGIYQWALLSNVYEKFVFIGSWEEFSVKLLTQNDLRLLVEGHCDKFKISDSVTEKNIEVYFSNKCIKLRSESVDYYTIGDDSFKKESDNSVITLPKIEEESNKWITPAFALLAAGLAYSLKDKHVTLRAPGIKF